MDVPQEQENRSNSAKRNSISCEVRVFSSCPKTTARYRLPQFLTSLRRPTGFLPQSSFRSARNSHRPSHGNTQTCRCRVRDGTSGLRLAATVDADMEDSGRNLAPWSRPPVVRVANGTSEDLEFDSRSAPRLTNSALPGDWRNRFGNAKVAREHRKAEMAVKFSRPETRPSRALQKAKFNLARNPGPAASPLWANLEPHRLLGSACGMRSALRIPIVDIRYGTGVSPPVRTHVRSRDAEEPLQ